LTGSFALDCLAFRPPTPIVCGRESVIEACSCIRRANSAGVTSSGLALAVFFLATDCFAVTVVDDFARTTEASRWERASVLPGVVTTLVSSGGGARGLPLLTRFVAGVSAITSVNSSMTDDTPWMEVGVEANVEVLVVLCPSPETAVELLGRFPFFSDRGCSEPGDALRLVGL